MRRELLQEPAGWAGDVHQSRVMHKRKNPHSRAALSAGTDRCFAAQHSHSHAAEQHQLYYGVRMRCHKMAAGPSR